MIRVVIADDEALIRTGFRLILDTEEGLSVVGEAADGGEALRVCARERPDVVLLDVRMPVLDGLSAAARLLAAPPPQPRVLMLTTFDRDEYVYDALRAGAAGFLLKTVSPERLVEAVQAAAAGETQLSPQITRQLVDSYIRRPPPALPAALDVLTSRELDVLRAVAKGLSNADVARELSLSEATVKTYLARLLAKLGLRSRAQAVSYAYEIGLVRPGS